MVDLPKAHRLQPIQEGLSRAHSGSDPNLSAPSGQQDDVRAKASEARRLSYPLGAAPHAEKRLSPLAPPRLLNDRYPESRANPRPRSSELAASPMSPAMPRQRHAPKDLSALADFYQPKSVHSMASDNHHSPSQLGSRPSKLPSLY